MERKIGEIFELGGEWYQCIKGVTICHECDLRNIICQRDTNINNPFKECSRNYRTDKEDVIFKKLEKVGEPMKMHDRIVLKVKADAYKCMGCCFYSKAKCELTMQECKHYDCGEGTKFIEIKQTKEDMEEKNNGNTPLNVLTDKYVNGDICYDDFEKEVKALYSCKEEIKPNLKEFDLEAAKAGKPVCTMDGRKARIICFDRNDLYPIVALIECEDGKEMIGAYSKEGHTEIYEIKGTDLMMLSEKKEGWVNVYYDNDASSHRGCRYI